MKIELTNEQFMAIQNEIIRLEEKLADERDKMNGWDYDYICGKISSLKKICEDESINLDEIIF